MKISHAKKFRLWSLVFVLFCIGALRVPAEPMPVRHIRGTVHGFLELRSEDGHVVASGDMTQVVSGSRVTSRLLFHFKDGSIDDETTVFSQHHDFRLISYHHVQKGPSFPHPIDLSIDARSGQVTMHSKGKDGKDELKTDHMRLPPDLANGLVSVIIENMPANNPETKVPILAATDKPRLVTLDITSQREEEFSLAGESHKAIHFLIKIDLGGVAGVVAPMIGKQPPNIELWAVEGTAPTFVKEQGPIYPDGPVYTMQLASPTWPESHESGN